MSKARAVILLAKYKNILMYDINIEEAHVFQYIFLQGEIFCFLTRVFASFWCNEVI